MKNKLICWSVILSHGIALHLIYFFFPLKLLFWLDLIIAIDCVFVFFQPKWKEIVDKKQFKKLTERNNQLFDYLLDLLKEGNIDEEKYEGKRENNKLNFYEKESQTQVVSVQEVADLANFKPDEFESIKKDIKRLVLNGIKEYEKAIDKGAPDENNT
jgi:hypothetical protein